MRWNSHDVKRTVPSPPSYTPQNMGKSVKYSVMNSDATRLESGWTWVGSRNLTLLAISIDAGLGTSLAKLTWPTLLGTADGKTRVRGDTHSDNEIEQMWALATHVSRPISELTILVRRYTVLGRIGSKRRAARGSPSRMGDKELREIALDASSIKPARGSKLVIDITR